MYLSVESTLKEEEVGAIDFSSPHDLSCSLLPTIDNDYSTPVLKKGGGAFDPSLQQLMEVME
jgi:hypothetical protein